MVLKTLQAMGPMHAYGLAKRIEQASQGRLLVNYGTIYPALIKLEQEGEVRSVWMLTETKRRAKFYQLTAAGRRRADRETRQWRATSEIMEHFLALASKPGANA